MDNRGRIFSAAAIVIAVLVMAVCFAVNLGSAWMGDRATMGQLLVTVFYILFWSGFLFFSKRRETLRKAALIITVIVLLSSICRLIFQLIELGFLSMIAAILTGALSMTLFYGFTYFRGVSVLARFRLFDAWSLVDLAAVVISAIWLAAAIRNVAEGSRRKKLRESARGRAR